MHPILKPLLRTNMIAFLHVITIRMKTNVSAGHACSDKMHPMLKPLLQTTIYIAIAQQQRDWYPHASSS